MTWFKNHTRLFGAILIVLIIVSIPVSIFFGSANLEPADVLMVLQSKIAPEKYADVGIGTKNVIIWNLRLPRILLAIAAGCALSVCGVAMQATTRNIMAEPYTLGVSSGASAFAALYISRIEGVYNLPISVNIAAFIGAFFSLMLVYSLASRRSYASNYKLILTGIIISMIFTAIRQFIVATTYNPNKVTSITMWEMGAFGAARWDNIFLPIILTVIGTVVLIFVSEQLNILSVGEQTAVTLGVSIKTIQRIVIVVTSVMVGIIVANSGLISFVGLIIPHIVRKIVGPDHRKVMPITALLGALFMIWTDVIARTIIAPDELAIGVLTSLIGGPFLLVLMLRKERR